jgi:hypothetical protein
VTADGEESERWVRADGGDLAGDSLRRKVSSIYHCPEVSMYYFSRWIAYHFDITKKLSHCLQR